MANSNDHPWRFSELVQRAGLVSAGNVDPIISSVVEDSRRAEPGCCFVAVRGSAVDGHQFVDAAVKAGAVAVVCEQPVQVPSQVAVLQVASARGVAGRLAAVLTGLDEELRAGRLKIIGITGTNGKSTFCYLAQSILREAQQPTALLGTVQYDLLSRKIEASMTTPPAVDLVAYLAEAAQAGATHAVMEVSSHALDQGRCDGLQFAVGVFSNLTGDHLDYHGNMETYLRAKKRLFDGLNENAVAVINRDDPAGDRMLADCRARVIRYGIAGGRGGGRGGEQCDACGESFASNEQGDASNKASVLRGGSCEVTAHILEQTAAGTRFRMVVEPGSSSRSIDVTGGSARECEIFSPLIGNHNVQNCLAAASAGLAVGLPLATIARGLAAVEVVPGRLQRVGAAIKDNEASQQPPAVFVDYAHTDDALRNVLSTLKPFAAGGRLIVLFGCGGDRDRTKRPRMARAVADCADWIVLTSDNPRTEDPQQILDDVLAGFGPGELERVQVEPDRRAAIERVVQMAQAGDVVLLAGKGHETYQIIGKEKLPFDDAAIAADALKARMLTMK